MKGRLKKVDCTIDYIYVSEEIDSYTIAYMVLHYSVTIFHAHLRQGTVLL